MRNASQTSQAKPHRVASSRVEAQAEAQAQAKAEAEARAKANQSVWGNKRCNLDKCGSCLKLRLDAMQECVWPGGGSPAPAPSPPPCDTNVLRASSKESQSKGNQATRQRGSQPGSPVNGDMHKKLPQPVLSSQRAPCNWSGTALSSRPSRHSLCCLSRLANEI